MVWLHWFHTLPLSSILSCLPASCLGISVLLSFACTLVQPLVCTHAFTFSSNPGFRFSSFVPVHLVPLHRSHVHFCPVLSPFHVFIFLSLLVLALAFFASPCGRRVCVPLGVTGILLDLCFYLISRGQRGLARLCSTKLFAMS